MCCEGKYVLHVYTAYTILLLCLSGILYESSATQYIFTLIGSYSFVLVFRFFSLLQFLACQRNLKGSLFHIFVSALTFNLNSWVGRKSTGRIEYWNSKWMMMIKRTKNVDLYYFCRSNFAQYSTEKINKWINKLCGAYHTLWFIYLQK